MATLNSLQITISKFQAKLPSFSLEAIYMVPPSTTMNYSIYRILFTDVSAVNMDLMSKGLFNIYDFEVGHILTFTNETIVFWVLTITLKFQMVIGIRQNVI